MPHRPTAAGSALTQALCDDLSRRWNAGTQSSDQACRVDADCRLLGTAPATNNRSCTTNIGQGCGFAVARSGVAPLIDELSRDYFAGCRGPFHFTVCGCVPLVARCIESRCRAVDLPSGDAGAPDR